MTLLVGARQSGKSTLIQEIAREAHPATYRTLDDADTLAAARRDPTAFVGAADARPLVIDEIQRAPELRTGDRAAPRRADAPVRRPARGLADLGALD